MSYCMTQVDQDFLILSAKKQEAFALLKQWEQGQIEKEPLLAVDYNRPLKDAETLEDALSELGWGVETDEDGSISYLYFNGEKLRDEDEWMDIIAPFVEKGSKIMMEGEDGAHWCWYFDGQSCVSYYGEVVYPDMPED